MITRRSYLVADRLRVTPHKLKVLSLAASGGRLPSAFRRGHSVLRQWCLGDGWWYCGQQGGVGQLNTLSRSGTSLG